LQPVSLFIHEALRRACLVTGTSREPAPGQEPRDTRLDKA